MIEQPIRVLMVTQSDADGGAARAALRLHESFESSPVVLSRMWVDLARSGVANVKSSAEKVDTILSRVRPYSVRPIIRMLKTGNPIVHSPSILCSRWVNRINSSDADVVHLHWVQGEMLSVKDICRIRKPIVWTLHDMWGFCGAEHYTQDDRWREGYRRDNRPPHETGFDLNRWTWSRKIKYWRFQPHIVTPSRWLAGCARESVVMRDWPIETISNPIDTHAWSPMPRSMAREVLGLPLDAPLLLFGAIGGGQDPRKGFDLLKHALEHLHTQGKLADLQLVVFGQKKPEAAPSLGFPVHYTGHLSDNVSLRCLYSAADAMVIPSRLDNLPNTGLEAQACGTPVIAFNTGGMRDIVEHKIDGYLAEPFETVDLANGISSTIHSSNNMGREARRKALRNYDKSVVTQRYAVVYASAMK